MALSIGELVGYVSLDTTGVAKGAAVAKGEVAGLGRTMDTSGTKAAGGFGRALKGVGLAMGGLGLAKVGMDSVNLEAQFSKSMALIQASTGATGAQMDKLHALAMKMGADTAFSASDAADAMLELGKAGISTSDIMGGALKGTMTLAAAGSLDMGSAATFASNAMNAFGLKGKDMGSIAAALAGGANASSASVESLGQALSQVGPAAKNSGLSLQQTVATLSAFDSAGIKGSDAGTSLKTMLQNLVPQSERASSAMADVGLFSKKTGSAFVKANGQFKSMGQISQLLHTHLSKLSESQRSVALTQIFGTDASRAAAVLMDQGAKGIKKYVKATKDQGAAQRMASANMSGTAGALERMKGSIETAELAFGQALAPAVVLAAGAIAGLANDGTKLIGVLEGHATIAKVVGLAIAAFLVPNLILMGVEATKSAAKSVAAWFTQQTAAAKTVAQFVIAKATMVAGWVLMGVQSLLGAAKVAASWLIAMGPIGIAIALVAGLVVLIVKHWDTIKRVTVKVWHAITGAVVGAWHGIVHGVSAAVGAVVGFVKSHWPLILAILTGPIGLAVLFIVRHFDTIKHAGSEVVSWIAGIPGKLGALAGRFGEAGKALLQRFVDGMKNAAGVISGIAGNVWDTVKGMLNGAIGKINAALSFTIHLPGPDVHVDLPDIPQLATGGRATRGTLAVIGEGREPESVLPDSVLHGLLTRAHDAGKASAQAGTGRQAPLIGAVYQAQGESTDVLAERLWFKTRTRG